MLFPSNDFPSLGSIVPYHLIWFKKNIFYWKVGSLATVWMKEGEGVLKFQKKTKLRLRSIIRKIVKNTVWIFPWPLHVSTFLPINALFTLILLEKHLGKTEISVLSFNQKVYRLLPSSASVNFNFNFKLEAEIALLSNSPRVVLFWAVQPKLTSTHNFNF